MADDNLAIEIFINDKKAEAVLAKTRASAVETDKVLTNVGKGFASGGLSRGLTEASQAALNLSNRSKLASGDALRLYNQLRDIRTTISTTTDPVMLKRLRNEAQLATFDLDQLEAKVLRVHAARSGGATDASGGMSRAQRAGRLNLTRQGADIFTGVGMGMDPSMIAIQQGPQIIDAMATSGLKFSRAMMISAGAIGGVALAGAAVVAWSKSAREEAEKRYKLEEQIQGIYNRQALLLKSHTEERNRAIQAQRQAFADEDFFNKANVEDLKLRRKGLQEIAALGPTFEKNEKTGELEISKSSRDTQAGILDLNEKIRKAQRAEITTSMAASAATFANSQEAERQAEKDRLEAIEKQRQKIEEMGRSYKEALLGIAGQSENPFVQVFLQGSSAIDKLKESLRGIPPELQRIAISAQQSLNGLAVFETRLQNRFEVADLRSLEEKLRETPAEALARFEQQYAQFQQTGHRHPIHEERFQRERERIANIEKFRLQENLDEKIQAASFARTDAERLRAARALVDIARSADPSQLRRDQRDDLAAAVRKVSEQKERDETQARETMQNLAAGVNKFNEIVGSPEFRKLAIDVTDKDGRVASVTNATPNDVAVNYEGAIF